MRTLPGVLFGASVLLIAPLVVPQAHATAATPPPIKWAACTDPVLTTAHAQCGTLTVPLDYQNPSGATVSLAVSRVVHTAPAAQYQGVMLTNPGGPGSSGLDLAAEGSFVPNGAGADYDWIGFDPRGVGSSRPALSCESDYFGYNRPDYTPSTPSQAQTWLDRSKAYAQACGKANAALLAHVTTIDSAQDMDSIRAALGQSQISYYGFSYGTYLGQVYSTLFPSHVKRMVLDSNVDPRGVWYQANFDQDTAFERNVKIWFTWVAKYDNVFHLGTTEQAVEQLFYQQRTALASKPAGGMIGPDEWTDIVEQAAYYRFGWVDIANAMSDWVHKGEWTDLKTQYDTTNTPGNDNSFAMYNAVQCTDVRWPGDVTTYLADNWRVSATAPFETWDNAWFNAPCLYWPATAGTPVHIDGSAVPSALLIDEELDAATPFEGSLEVRRLYPNASLIAEPGGATHADSLSGDACVDNQVAAYLANGTLPARKTGDGPDAVCAPLPDPVPTATQPTSGREALPRLPG